jgi:type III pantothenate kinase
MRSLGRPRVDSEMSLLLTIDAGNTNTVLGVHAGSELRAHWRLTTRREQTADEYGILVRSLFTASSVDPALISGVALASVVPPLTPVLVTLSRQYLGQEPLVVEPGVKTGMPILYEPPGDVGADRIVNGVAAFAAYGGPVIVVDFGTATTFDVVTRKGEYVGGVICPGVGISADALFQRAARLPRVDIRNPGRVVGRTTVASIQSGLYFGYAAMVEGIIGRIRSELDEAVRVVATGGLAETLAADVPSIEAVDPVLTLTGLRLIWEKNRGA